MNDSSDQFNSSDAKLIIPILDNSENDSILAESIKEVMKLYPETSAVAIRGRGMFIWAKTVKQCMIK